MLSVTTVKEKKGKKKKKRIVQCLGGCPGGTSGKEPVCQCRKHERLRFHP